MSTGWHALVAVIGLALATQATAQTVRLDVRFKLTDMDYQPLANQPVRITFGPDGDWMAPDTGQRGMTDAQGEARFTATVTLGTERVSRDTSWLNFLDTGEDAQTLEVFVGLPFLGGEWLYGVKTYAFADGDGMRQGFDVYLPDASGRYTRKFSEDAGTHTIELPDGLVLAGSGYEPWETTLSPAEDGTPDHWTLKLSYKKHPEPVRR